MQHKSASVPALGTDGGTTESPELMECLEGYMNIPEELFRVARTYKAFVKAQDALTKFEELGANDRHAAVEAALCGFSADLCSRVGRSDVARDLYKRAGTLLETARVAALSRRRKHHVKRVEEQEQPSVA